MQLPDFAKVGKSSIFRSKCLRPFHKVKDLSGKTSRSKMPCICRNTWFPNSFPWLYFFFQSPCKTDACVSKLCFWELYVTYVANVKEEKLAVVMQSRNLSSKAWRSLYGIMVHPTPFGRRKTKSKGREFSGKPESLFMLTFHNFFCRKYCNKDISKIPKTKVFDKHFPKI